MNTGFGGASNPVLLRLFRQPRPLLQQQTARESETEKDEEDREKTRKIDEGMRGVNRNNAAERETEREREVNRCKEDTLQRCRDLKMGGDCKRGKKEVKKPNL